MNFDLGISYWLSINQRTRALFSFYEKNSSLTSQLRYCISAQSFHSCKQFSEHREAHVKVVNETRDTTGDLYFQVSIF